MEQLRQLFEELNFRNVATFIASGNVIFDVQTSSVSSLERRIERHLAKKLGYPVETFLRTPDELVTIAAHRPKADADFDGKGHNLYIGFLADAPSADGKRAIARLQSDVDRVDVHRREIYWRVRGGFGDSKISGATLEKAVGMRCTLRNVTTVRRLAAKYGTPP
jgi:uncharacterized protein (DUF1697 family)